MTDIILPPGLRVARNRFRYIGNTGVTRGAYNGVAQTTGLGGDRVGSTLEFTMHGGKTAAERAQRAQLMAFQMRMRDKQNRVYMTDSAYQGLRGSFPVTEILANTDFSSTTSWTANRGTLSVADAMLRLTASSTGSNFYVTQTASISTYTPYVLRSLTHSGRGLSSISGGPYLGDGTVDSSSFSTTRGYRKAAFVSTASTTCFAFPFINSTASGFLARDYVDILFASLSRCILPDVGNNMLLYSDDFETVSSWTTIETSIGANATTGPDGSSFADSLIESNTNNVNHSVRQNVTVSSGAADYTLSVAVRSGTRSWAILLIQESAAAHTAYAFINLSTGALGTVSSTGANMANVRATVTDLGNTWYKVDITARKTNSTTTITTGVQSATADASFTYAGAAATVAIYIHRATLNASSHGQNLVHTTTAALSGQTLSGRAFRVKGLPVSSSGLLLPGDWFEVDDQLKMVTESLDSDAAGCGYLQFSPPLYRAISDNTPIIVNRPMGRFILASELAEWSNEPGVFTTGALEFEEAFA